MGKAPQGGKELIDLVDQWAPQIEKTLNQLATKGPKMLDKGRKIAKSKGAKVPSRHSEQSPLGGPMKKLVFLGGFAAIAYMAVRRLLGAGDEWQVPAPPPGEEVETDLS